MLRACCRGVREVRDEEKYWKHHTYLESHIHCKPSARGGGGGERWEMEEVGSKLHLFGCQHRDLEKFFKVRVKWTLVMVITLCVTKM